MRAFKRFIQSRTEQVVPDLVEFLRKKDGALLKLGNELAAVHHAWRAVDAIIEGGGAAYRA